MKKIKPLSYTDLKYQLDPGQLSFKSTANLKSAIKFIGQNRALAAIEFGIEISNQGYNLFAMGPVGIGKFSFIEYVLKNNARKQKTPDDWCYLYNFACPDKPLALSLPAGGGQILQKEMKVLIDKTFNHITAVFQSRVYQKKLTAISNKYGSENSVKCKKQFDRIKKLEQKTIHHVILPLFTKIKRKYKKHALLLEYFTAVINDLILHASEIITQQEDKNSLLSVQENPALVKYKINVLVDNSHLKGAPIVFEETPTYSNLICRIEHTSEQGTLLTNFTLIRPGSLHRANGGYLIIEARKIKKNIEAWEALKSCLYSEQIKIKHSEPEDDHLKPVSLEPEPIPLKIKVILLGERNTYYNLCQRDPEFNELFKVPVDFDEQVDRNAKNIELYAKLIAGICQRRKLHPFTASAVACVIDYSSRLAEDKEKLSTHIQFIQNLMIEAHYWLEHENTLSKAKTSTLQVKVSHVKKALQAQIYRMNRAKELYFEDITRHFILIQTSGTALGQVNCLSVRKVGNFSYGHPTRVTARIRLGRGKFIDIQREIKMAGPLHSKAGLIISNFLASCFSEEKLYSLTASIAFEQIYCWTDGDSASVGELCAVLSALASVPLAQNLAITGSSDQYGNVQIVGGLNEKVEGFFDLCASRGLTGNQGVIIPNINIKNLLLKDEVLTAIQQKKFFIFPIDHVDQAIELLSNLPSGKIAHTLQTHYPAGSFYHKIEQRLSLFSKKRLLSK